MRKTSGMKTLLWCGVAASIAALGAVAATPAKAAEAREELRAQFDKALKGKTVAWAPVWLGVLESEWTRVMKAHFDDYGMKFEVRDANFKSDVQLQAVSELINEHPDVLVVQAGLLEVEVDSTAPGGRLPVFSVMEAGYAVVPDTPLVP